MSTGWSNQFVLPVVDVVDGDWGDGGDPAAIRDVCDLVLLCAFWTAIDEKPIGPIQIQPSLLKDPPRPRTLAKRSESGHIVVWLSARGVYLPKYVYQFAHEFCHIMANYPPLEPLNDTSGNTWIEESLCEMASFYALEAISDRLRDRTPIAAEEFKDYADRNAADHTRLSAGDTFTRWLDRTRPALEADYYRREDNALVALQLLPIFKQNPDAWRAVRYLNMSSTHSLQNYFAMWRSAAPSCHHGVINRIADCLGADRETG